MAQQSVNRLIEEWSSDEAPTVPLPEVLRTEAVANIFALVRYVPLALAAGKPVGHMLKQLTVLIDRAVDYEDAANRIEQAGEVPPD